MQSQECAVIMRMGRANMPHYHYRPFPGRNPVRLLTQVTKVYPGTLGQHPVNPTVLVHRYNGKFTTQALFAYHRVLQSMEGGMHRSFVIAYCQSGILFRGTELTVTPHRHFNTAFSGITCPDSRRNNRFTLPIQAVTPLKLFGMQTLCWDALPPVGTPEYKDALSLIRRQYRGISGGSRFVANVSVD